MGVKDWFPVLGARLNFESVKSITDCVKLLVIVDVASFICHLDDPSAAKMYNAIVGKMEKHIKNVFDVSLYGDCFTLILTIDADTEYRPKCKVSRPGKPENKLMDRKLQLAYVKEAFAEDHYKVDRNKHYKTALDETNAYVLQQVTKNKKYIIIECPSEAENWATKIARPELFSHSVVVSFDTDIFYSGVGTKHHLMLLRRTKGPNGMETNQLTQYGKTLVSNLSLSKLQYYMYCNFLGNDFVLKLYRLPLKSLTTAEYCNDLDDILKNLLPKWVDKQMDRSKQIKLYLDQCFQVIEYQRTGDWTLLDAPILSHKAKCFKRDVQRYCKNK